MSTPTASQTGVFLLEDQVIAANGESTAIPLQGLAGGLLTLTLGILEVLEQQSVEIQILSSVDGESWSDAPVLEFPQRFYTGTTALVLNLSATPDVAFLKAKWTVNRWGRGEATPRFRMYVFAAAA